MTLDLTSSSKDGIEKFEQKTLYIEGGHPLMGTVKLSGSKNSALKLICAAMFSNEDVILDNVPRVEDILSDLQIITALGGKAQWVSENTLVLNGSGLNSYEIPSNLGCKSRTSALLTAPLVYRFGQAIVPKYVNSAHVLKPINRWIDTWKSLGMSVEENAKFLYVKADNLQGAAVGFKVSTHMGTDNAVMSAIFVPGETTISNAAEEAEVEDLINFCKIMGADVERIEPRKIKVTGKNMFGGGSFTVQSDKHEAAAFCIASILTGGNVTIKNINKMTLGSFVNVLSKIGCKYEFSKDDIKVWYSNENLKGVNVTTYPAPGFTSDWQPLITLLLTKAEGESLIHDTVFIDRFGYTKDLNRMGAKIELFKPSQVGLIPVISNDSYDFAKLGEPFTVAKFTGPFKLKGTKLHISDLRGGLVLVIAALAAEGRSEISGYELIESGYEHIKEKLIELGAKISTER